MAPACHFFPVLNDVLRDPAVCPYAGIGEIPCHLRIALRLSPLSVFTLSSLTSLISDISLKGYAEREVWIGISELFDGPKANFAIVSSCLQRT